MGFFNNTQVKKSGTHTTVKIQMPVAKVMQNIHPSQPMKGTHNPPHVQVRVPPSMAKNVTK